MNSTAARPLRWRLLVGATLGVIVVALGIGEAMGWPFLGAPVQRWLSTTLKRDVSFSEGADPQLRVHLLGGVSVDAAVIRIGAPAWSKAPQMLLARDAHITLGYLDLWRASRGEPLRIRELRAGKIDAEIEQLADGRASWQFGEQRASTDRPMRLPSFGLLQVDAGQLVVRDALNGVDAQALFSLTEGAGDAAGKRGFTFDAKGRWRDRPLLVALKTSGVLPVIAEDAASVELPVSLEASIGASRLSFTGSATDALHLTALKGRFSVQGPSLAAVGDPLRVTLPTTGPFRAQGLVAKQGLVWNVVMEQVAIGSSRLGGAFTYDPRSALPVLSGRLTGSRLLLADLGPAVGAPVRTAAAANAVPAPDAAQQRRTAKPGRVLPDREFDLPALRAMNANVLIDIADLDLGSSFLEPLKPMRTHLVLSDGVLLLRDIDARTGQGRLGGQVQLDGRHAQALWTADLRWSGVRLESWIHQARADAAPPYATGSLSGQARVAGQGKSTAAILGSLRGGVRMQLTNGTISHLAVEAAGLDIAQGLGILIKGDESLPVQCSVVDLVAEQGQLRPRVLVLDTRDSTLWIDGSLSLATESMDLRVVVVPKDFSPLALRTPLHLRGNFAKPEFALDAGRLGTRLGASALLALINPFAALIPLMDIGNSAESERSAEGCRALSARIAAHPALAAPKAAAASTRPAR